MQPGLHTVESLAEAMAVHPITVRRWIAARTVPASQIGHVWRIWGPAASTALFGPGSHVEALMGAVDADDLPATDIISVRELADRLGMGYGTAARLVSAGVIPAARVGRTYRIHWPTVRDKIARGEDFTAASDPV